MANVTLDARFIIRNDTSTLWTTNNPILLKGEMGIELDSGKFKVGDGVNTWTSLDYASATPSILLTTSPSSTDSDYDIGTIAVNTTTNKAYILLDNTSNSAVWKQIVTPDDLSDLGAGDMLKSAFATNVKVTQGYVDKAIIADKITTPVSIGLNGDVTASAVNFDGSGNITLTTAIANTVAAGTYIKITVNSKGLVTGFETLTASDIPSLTLSKITDAGTAAGKNTGISAGNVIVVGEDGYIDGSIIPAIAIMDIFEISSESAMLATTAQQGDIAVRSDINKTFILKQSPASTLSNWVELKTPTDTVLSVNGQTGVITLTTSNISEGSNLYYTETRATTNFNTNFATKASTGLTDGATILHNTDTYILNGGTSAGW